MRVTVYSYAKHHDPERLQSQINAVIRSCEADGQEVLGFDVVIPPDPAAREFFIVLRHGEEKAAGGLGPAGEGAREVPEPMDPEAIRAAFDGSTENQRALHEAIRRMVQSRVLSRGQLFEWGLRSIRESIEKNFTSVADRTVAMQWYYERLGHWIDEAAPSEN